MSRQQARRRRHGYIAAGILLSLACLGVRAETAAERLETARQLTAAMQYGEMYESALAQCTKPGNALYDPAVVLENHPAAFRGITRQSGYWPEIEAAYRRYHLRSCAYLSAEDFTQFMAQQLAERTSLDDLRTALAFYSTPAGQRLQKVAMDINTAHQEYANKAMQKAVLEADKQTREEVGAIIARYLQEPK